MAIMPQIAMGFQMPQIQLPNQGNMLMQISQIQAAQQANALRQSQMQKMQMDAERENQLAQMLMGGGEATLPQLVQAGGPTRGIEAFEAMQKQRGAQQKQARERETLLGRTLFHLNSDPSDANLERARRNLRQAGLSDGLDETIDQMLQLDPNQRRLTISQIIQANPDMALYIQEFSKKQEDLRSTATKTGLTQAQTDVERARLAGTLPRGEQQRLAPNVQTIADPDDPTHQLLIDVTQYRGGGLGSPGTIGRPGTTREPSPVVATIQDPTDPTRTISINVRDYRGGGAGAPGVYGVAGEQAKVSREEIKKDISKTQVNDTLDEIAGMYAELNRLGGITSTQRSGLSNLPAWAAGTEIGQTAGRAIGTEEQSLRERIKAARFALVQQIRNATGLSARQMDSNVELRNTLDSLSDVSQGYEAATSIIEDLRKKYGRGSEPASRGAAGGQPAAAPGAPAPPRVGEVRQGYRFQGGDPADRNSWKKVD